MDVAVIVFSYIIGLSGMIVHWFECFYFTGKTVLNPIKYLITNKAASFKALSALFVAILGVFQTGIILDYHTVQGFSTYFLLGYFSNRFLNTDQVKT
jgi:hypothetical protein